MKNLPCVYATCNNMFNGLITIDVENAAFGLQLLLNEIEPPALFRLTTCSNMLNGLLIT